jgi:hypothetical protein
MKAIADALANASAGLEKENVVYDRYELLGDHIFIH